MFSMLVQPRSIMVLSALRQGAQLPVGILVGVLVKFVLCLCFVQMILLLVSRGALCRVQVTALRINVVVVDGILPGNITHTTSGGC